MKRWAFALLAHCVIIGGGIGLMGEAFFEIAIFHAPMVNLLLWSGLICLAGLAHSAAAPGWHRGLVRVLLAAAVAWFPVSLLIFGNARFSGTTDFLWNAWLIGTGVLLLAPPVSLLAVALRSIHVRMRGTGRDA